MSASTASSIRWYHDIIYAAIILYNMIVDNEGEGVADEDTAGPSQGISRRSHRQGVPYDYAEYLRTYVDIR